ncbi:MAG: NAD(P)-binding domain-containing protein [Rhizobacter sp.]|nr:NAD(P)-binding domain-containing protein [Ferruginibacter sp.]
MKRKQIGIIGAGISGLATAKAFKERGYGVTVLEKAGSVGGVWERSRSYIKLTTQTTKNEYSFSDYPMPAAFPEWPSGENMSDYLTCFAKHFGLAAHIFFDKEVLSMEFRNKQWTLAVQDLHDKTTMEQHFDFVVVCTGTFHEKHIPAFEGVQQFIANGGQVLHSSEVKDENLLKDKHVAVVGFAKSATDIATAAADLSRSATLLYRKAQWKVPRFFGNTINLKYLLFSRFSEAFFMPYRKTGFQKILHSIGRPMVWMQWRGIELLLKKQFRLKACGMLPQHRIEEQISCSLGVAPQGFYEKVLSKKINAVHDEIASFSPTGFHLKKGGHIDTDLVVFGTGFKQSLPFLPNEIKKLLRNEAGQFELYRNIINPKIPALGFVGFNSSLFSTLTSEVAANWLAEYVSGHIILPEQKLIDQEIGLISNWKQGVRPIAKEFSGLCVAPFNFQHLDQLMQDMGMRTRATRNPFYEFFKPINPKDYQKILRRPDIFKQLPQVKQRELQHQD